MAPRLRTLLSLFLLLGFAGCLDQQAEPAEPGADAGLQSPDGGGGESLPPTAPVGQATVVPFEFAGELGVFACAPMPTGGCTGMALISTDTVAELPNGALSKVELQATWQAETPASSTLWFRICVNGECPADSEAISGTSPLALAWTFDPAIDEDVVLAATTMNPFDGAGWYGQVRDGTSFAVTGTLTYT